MKRVLLITILLASLSVKAQVYNNEWIDYSKTYYKFKIAATNLYRISQATLSGIGLSGVNADHFQLWRNGQEIPLYTTSQNAPLATGGYIEFWGEMNDGRPDNPMYRNPDFQLNNTWSLQTDTAAFFLTVNSNTPNRRFASTTNDLTGNTLSPEPFFIHTAGNYYKDRLFGGAAQLVGTSYVYSSSFDEGEGYTSGDIGTNANVTTTFSALSPYTGAGAPSPLVRVHAAGNAVNPRYFRINLNGDSVHAASMDFYNYAKVSKPVNVSQISSGTAAIQIVNRCANAGDRMVVAQVELEYPRTFNFGNQRVFPFTLPANGSESYLEISNFNRSTAAPVLYDLTNGRRYVCDISSGSLNRVKLQPSATERNLVLVNQIESWIGAVVQMEPRNFVDYGLAANQGDYLIITNSALTGATPGGDPVEDYRLYRSSPQGGGYHAKVYLIDQLVDQFAFGIKMHPLSIRNFLRWARASYSAPLTNVLLIGKGVIYTSYRTGQSNADMGLLQLIPTFGSPASDMLLSAAGSSSLPLTPIGRISAISKNEVTDYLNKVREYEADQHASSSLVADQSWKKNVIHVTGGSDDGTSNILKAALDGQKPIIEDSMYGAKVYTFAKSTADAVQQLSSSELARLLSAGIGVLTYFGHSSASTLEFNLENPENYNNQGKYPIMIVMGCNAGNFFGFNTGRLTFKETISEKYLLAKERGAVAFLASTHLGIVHYLDIYNKRHYETISSTHYGATVGEIMVETIKKVFQFTTESDFYARMQCEQFTLHGDPSLRYHAFQKPDYAIEAQMVEALPKILSVAETEFVVKVKVINLGSAPKKNVVVEARRTFPDLHSEVIRRDTIAFNKLEDSLSYILPIVASRDKGLNKISIVVDVDNEIDELYETNNSITKDVFIIEDNIRPAYPYDLSIQNSSQIRFIATTANPFAADRSYRIDIDTSALFGSPAMVSQSKISSGSVVEFEPSLSLIDSTVYYWRVGPSSSPLDSVYTGFSFQYIVNGQPGFSQAHYYQHTENKLNKIVYEDDRQFKFKLFSKEVAVSSGIYPYAGQTSQFSISVNGESNMAQHGLYGPLASNNNVLRFYVIKNDGRSMWQNVSTGTEGLYGSTNPTPINGTVKTGFFQFNISTIQGRQNVMNFIDLIPDGDVIVMTNPPYSSMTLPGVWMGDTTTLGSGNSLYHKLAGIGFTSISQVNSFVPFIFVVRKGVLPAIRQEVASAIQEILLVTFSLETSNYEGTVLSRDFGPAIEWGTVKWSGFFKEENIPDDLKLNIIGVRNNGATDTLSSTDIPGLSIDLSSVNAKDYPYLRLQLYSEDSTEFTPYQLRYWQVSGTPAPEGVIAPDIYFTTKDTVEIGQPFDFGIAFKNISTTNFDSIKVKLTITDSRNIENIIPVPRQKDLVVNDTIKLNVKVDTRSLAGSNTLFVNFNPDNDQPEQYLFNNYAFRSLYVKPDSTNPLLDVTFDGVHILNKDIVAAKPNILIKLKDESKWMVVDDTSAIAVQVRYPDGSLKKYFYYNNNDTMRWIPAGQPPVNDNSASVDFTPYFDQDGEYELIVTGKDRSSNFAGVSEYRVSFQVINKPMISNMLNYPNPFTTSTAFVFTLTGTEVPENIRIQILTVTGKIVREITKQELGPLRIGRNTTEFKWDGTDQYGQQLGNGVYLYRVITSMNGKPLDKYKAEGDNTDKYFNKGYGKMYLMR